MRARPSAGGKNDASQRILTAAFKCISTRGSANVSLRDIADEADVALSQLNYYYNNRETLFAAVLAVMKKDYIANVEAKMESFPTLKEKAQFLVHHNRELLQNNKRLYRAFLDFFGLAMWSKSFQKEMNGFLNDISRIIEHQIDSGASNTGNAPLHSSAVQASLILGTTFGIAMQYLMNPERQEILEGFDMLLRAL